MYPAIIGNRSMNDDEDRAFKIINRLNEIEESTILANILDEIITNVVYNQGKDIVGIVNDYEYTVDIEEDYL